MAASSVPSILVASCTDFEAKELVKQILGNDDLPAGKSILEDIEGYSWHVDTKYYTADVQLCTTSARSIGNQDFADSVQAFIAYFDSNQESSFTLLKSWLPYLKEIQPEVQMLVCTQCSDNDVISRLTVQRWCIDNFFELIELNPEESSDDDDCEDDFAETTGIKRIIQALQAHTWPNLVMKETPNICSPFFRQLMQEASSISPAPADDSGQTCNKKGHHLHGESYNLSNSENKIVETHKSENMCTEEEDKLRDHKCSSEKQEKSDIDYSKDSENKETIDSRVDGAEQKTEDESCASGGSKNKQSTQQSKIDSLFQSDEIAMLEALGNDDPGGESFEKLFERLHLMKDEAETLPEEERKAYAEKVVLQFWKAIGGDEDEIEGLDDVDFGEK